MVALPFFKIFAVLFKEATKPLAAQLKLHAQNHSEARRLAMILGRRYEAFSQRLEAMLTGQRFKELRPITDAHALTVGADLVSQTFLLSIALSLVVVEYWRSNKLKEEENAAKKLEKQYRQMVKETRLQTMEQRIAELERRLIEQEDMLNRRREAENAIAAHTSVLRHTHEGHVAEAQAMPVSAPAAPTAPSAQHPGWWAWLFGPGATSATDDFTKASIFPFASACDLFDAPRLLRNVARSESYLPYRLGSLSVRLNRQVEELR